MNEVTVDTYNQAGEKTKTETYSGDPKQYAKGDGNFLNKDGEIKNVSDMTRAERTAYDKWLAGWSIIKTPEVHRSQLRLTGSCCRAPSRSRRPSSR